MVEIKTRLVPGVAWPERKEKTHEQIKVKRAKPVAVSSDMLGLFTKTREQIAERTQGRKGKKTSASSK